MISRFQICIFALFVFFSWNGCVNSQNMTMSSTQTRVEILFSIPSNAWKPARQLDNPSYDPGGPKRMKVLPDRITIGHDGHILAYNTTTHNLTKYDRSGKVLLSFSVMTPVSNLDLIDFCGTQSGYAFLLRQDGEETLHLFSPDGTKKGALQPETWGIGKGTQLISLKNDLFYIPDRYPLKVARINPDKAQKTDFHNWEDLDHEMRIAPDGQLLNIYQDNNSKSRGLLLIDSTTGKSEHQVFQEKWRMLLLGLLGGDRDGNVYFYGQPSASEPKGIYKFDRKGNLKGKFLFEQMSASEELGQVIYWGTEKEETWVQFKGKQSGTARFPQPDRKTDLAGISDDGHALLIHENKAGLPGTMLKIEHPFSGLNEAELKGNMTVYRNQDPEHWAISDKGEVLIPVSTALGLVIVAITL